MNKINILHIRSSSGLFGAERVILNLGKYIDNDHFHFILLCMDNQKPEDKPLINKATSAGMQVITLKIKGRLDLSALASMRRLFRENRINIIHSHDFKSNFYGLIASINKGIKRVTTVHGSTRDSILIRIYLFFDEMFVCAFFHKIIAVSRDLADQLRRKSLSNNKITVIQNGINPMDLNEIDERQNSEPVNLSKGHKVFGVVGRLYPDKGHRFFLQAFSRICHNFPSARALIVGDGPTKEGICFQIQRLNLNERVLMCGIRSDMKYIYESIDCLIIPSLREGLPYVLLEAMVCRIPVIASAVGDIPRVITDGVTGYLVPPGDIKTLEKRMVHFLNYPDKHKIMTEKGYTLVKEKFSAKKMVRDTERLYQSVTA